MKNDYRKNDFYVKKDKKGYKSYFMKIQGTYFEVPHEVFNVCYASYRKQLRDMRRNIDNELTSLDQELESGTRLIDMIADPSSRFNAISFNDEVETVLGIIETLSEEDKNLITNLLLKEKTERELAKQMNVSQSAIYKRKNNILEKLRKKLNE